MVGCGQLLARVTLALHIALRCVDALVLTPSFLIISAPQYQKVSWVLLGDDSNHRPVTLISTGLSHPQGVAVDHKRKVLYVADPDDKVIYGYKLLIKDKDLSVDGDPFILSNGVESRWVAVDATGHVYFSDEPENRILKVNGVAIAQGNATAAANPEVLFDGNAVAQVSRPGGVAADTFHVYWTNKELGTDVGSVVRAPGTSSAPNAADNVGALAKNVVKSYGVCASLGNVYFTDEEKFLYGVRKTGGPISEVSSSLQEPRGCASDLSGTVYVADRAAGVVYSFPGDMPSVTATELTKAISFDDAFGLAVLRSSAKIGS